MTRDARLSALHRDDFRPGAALPSPALPPDPYSDAPRSQVVLPGGRCPGPPEPAVTSRGRRTPLPAPPFRTVSRRRPSMSEDGNLCTINSLRSQDKSHKVADKITRFRPCAGGRSIHLSSQSVAEDVAIGARFDVAAEAVFQLGAVEGGLLELLLGIGK